jgi:hypothetical protein
MRERQGGERKSQELAYDHHNLLVRILYASLWRILDDCSHWTRIRNGMHDWEIYTSFSGSDNQHIGEDH